MNDHRAIDNGDGTYTHIFTPRGDSETGIANDGRYCSVFDAEPLTGADSKG